MLGLPLRRKKEPSTGRKREKKTPSLFVTNGTGRDRSHQRKEKKGKKVCPTRGEKEGETGDFQAKY